MKFIKKIKLKSKEIFEQVLIEFILLIKSPKLVAFLMALTVKNINTRGKYKVLCLRRTIFMDDVKAMAKFSGQLHYVALSRNIIQGIFWHFVDTNGKKDLHYQDYHSGKYYQEGIQKYYEFLKKLIPELQKRIKFDVIFSGNFVYVEQQELARVCKELSIPFIILHKEGLTAGLYKDSAELYNGCKFVGDKVMIYNEKVRESFLALDDLSDVSDDSFVVVGPPRIDYLFNDDIKISPKKQIVLFSSIPTMRFSRIFKDKGILDKIGQRSEDFHRWAMQFAIDHPDIKVIIKTKVAKYYLQYPKKIFKKYFKQGIPNLEITSAGNPSELIMSSMAICAFSSMTQIEAIVIDQPVISAYYGDLVTAQPWDYFGEYPGLVKYAKNYTEFESDVLNYKNLRNRDENMKEAFLQRFIGFTDGQSSQRAEEEIIKVINNELKKG